MACTPRRASVEADAMCRSTKTLAVDEGPGRPRAGATLAGNGQASRLGGLRQQERREERRQSHRRPL
eukprot:5016626-Alexandrium_andersonii.AAC.1